MDIAATYPITEVHMRVRHAIATTFPVLLAGLVACGGVPTPPSDPVREQAAIRAADASWLAAAQAHDLERTLAYWTDDVILMQPGAPAVVGKEALRRYVSGAFAIPGFSISWVTDRVWVAKAGDLAYSTGTDTIRMTSPEGKPLVELNKAVAVWRKGPDGAWRCAVDIWNAEGDSAASSTESR